ncbi:predicted protein [Naegleria gruberi]|uniref:Predicted protein n=1 Tax=Naegleria gruberi TaxID=5762 RepID=D2V0D6_NAEGR|nr:uncharacterized protein NAEGRDRAFT_62256 [Naegleria gruberi]EFC49700.1 predicted protein [Naegleria gruberi]|eukprot:XP_002682444.1 predicted protein [Naegleria gruberi strain NEG-M]
MKKQLLPFLHKTFSVTPTGYRKYSSSFGSGFTYHEESSFTQNVEEKKKRNRIKLHEEVIISTSKKFNHSTSRKSLKIISSNTNLSNDMAINLKKLTQIANNFNPIFEQLDRGNYHKALFLLEKGKDLFDFIYEEHDENSEKYTVLSIAKICDTLLCHFDQTKEYLKIQKILIFLKDYTKDNSWNKKNICDPITQKGISFLVRLSINSMKEEYGKRLFEAVNNNEGNSSPSAPSLQLLLDIFRQDDFTNDSSMQQCLSFVVGMSNSDYYIMDIYSLDIILELLIEGRKYETAYLLVKQESDRLILPFITCLANDHTESHFFSNSHVYEIAHKLLTIFGECKYYDQVYEVYKLIKRPSQRCFNLLIYYLSESNKPDHLRILIDIIQENITNKSNYVHIISPINIRDLFRSESKASSLMTYEQVSTLFDIFLNKLNIKCSTRILNIFLNLQLKHGKEADALKTLTKFEENGVQINVSTLTIILTYLANNAKYEDAIKICDRIIREPLVFDIPFLNIVWKIYHDFIWNTMMTIDHTVNIGTDNIPTTFKATNIPLLESIKAFEKNNQSSLIDWKKNLHENPLFDTTKEKNISTQTMIFEYLVIQMERSFDKYILTSYSVMGKLNEEQSKSKTSKADWYMPQSTARHLRYGTRSMDEESFLSSSDSSIPHFLQNKQSKLIASDTCRLDLRILIQNYAIKPRLRQIDDLLEFVSGAYSRNNSLRRYYYLRVIISLLESGNISHVKLYVKYQFENCEMSIQERINTMHLVLKTIRSKYNATIRDQYRTEWRLSAIDSLTKLIDLLSIEEWNQVMTQCGMKNQFENYDQLTDWIKRRFLSIPNFKSTYRSNTSSTPSIAN